MAQAARKILAGDRAAADQLKKDAEFLKEQKAIYLKPVSYTHLDVYKRQVKYESR